MEHPRHDERGASAVEYGLLITGIAGLIVLMVFQFGGVLSGSYDDTCDDFATHAATTGC